MGLSQSAGPKPRIMRSSVTVVGPGQGGICLLRLQLLKPDKGSSSRPKCASPVTLLTLRNTNLTFLNWQKTAASQASSFGVTRIAAPGAGRAARTWRLPPAAAGQHQPHAPESGRAGPRGGAGKDPGPEALRCRRRRGGGGLSGRGWRGWRGRGWRGPAAATYALFMSQQRQQAASPYTRTREI